MTKTKGCGCGGGCGCGCGGAKRAGCGCGGSGGCGCKPARLPEAAPAPCSPCETASFVRPRFFAGQLLTEDDLEALIDYTVAKNRFHNARLFGAGVVCGLEVECGPCDSSKILVEPGYALDCCGNDLVLTCERTLDIAPMIRALGGVDCSDPCPEPATTGKATPAPNTAPTAEPKTKRFCLYARYAERPDQPVAAYPVGDDCDAARCEPTRMIEGITFELRCPPCAPPPKTWRDFRKEREGSELGTLALAAARVANQRRPALAREEALEFDPRELELSIAHLPDAERMALRVDTLARLAPFAARETEQAERAKALHDHAIAAYAEQHLNAIRQAKAPTRLDDTFQRSVVARWEAILSGDRARYPEDAMRVLIQYGVVWGKELAIAAAEHVAITAEQLQKLAGCLGKLHTHCDLRDRIDRLPRTPNPKGADAQGSNEAFVELDDVAKLVQELLADCECAAFNPPCPRCDDPGVLLACLEVDRCNVVEICNTNRQYVLAPNNLRYWGLRPPMPRMCACCAEPAHAEYVPPERRGDLLENRAMAEPIDVIRGRAPVKTPDTCWSSERDVSALEREVAVMRERLACLELQYKGKTQ